jgi:hypothetical protein
MVMDMNITRIMTDVRRLVGLGVQVIIRAVDVVVGARDTAGTADRRCIVVCLLGR